MDTGMVRGRGETGDRDDARVVRIALAGLALSAACGSGGKATGSDAGTDSGSTGSLWRTVMTPSEGIFSAVALDGAGAIYAVAEAPFGSNPVASGVTWSHDDGATWTSVPLPNQTSTILSVAAVGPTDVYAVGYAYDAASPDDSPPVIARSTDRGATFTLVNPTFAGIFTAVAADNAGNPIGVGSTSAGGFFVRSADGGNTWSSVPVPGTAWLDGVWTTASGTIYACGEATPPADAPDGGADAGTDAGVGGPTALDPYGAVVRSDDGGATWTTLATSPAPLHAISGSADGQHIVAVGYGYTEIESRDAGASWQVDCGSDYVSKPFSGFGSVWVQDATTAPFIAAGNAPYVVRSVAFCGGPGQSIETWEALPYIGLGDAASGIEAGVIAVAGTSPTNVWAVGVGIFRRM
jgi:hypothetical protein